MGDTIPINVLIVRRSPAQMVRNLALAGVGAAAAVWIALAAGWFGLRVGGWIAAGFFVWSMLRLWRGRGPLRVDESGVTQSAACRIAWDDLSQLRLGYYATRRDGSKGWFELRLRGGGKTIRVESSADGFCDLVRRAHDTARQKGLTLDAVSIANLTALTALTDEESGP